MTEHDIAYIRRLIERKIIASPVLELGAGYGGDTCKDVTTGAGLQYYSTDITASTGVDYVADFEADDICAYFADKDKFKTILILNVLEHTLNPVRVLDNARKLLDRDGSLILITPCSWALHNYPVDCCRLLPNFYERYAETRGMVLDPTCFEYLEHGLVSSNRDAAGDYRFPLPASGFAYWRSRAIHQLFNTFGRGMYGPSHVAIGAVLSMSCPQCDLKV
jgi:SAM-dependent methyltransferase